MKKIFSFILPLALIFTSPTIILAEDEISQVEAAEDLISAQEDTTNIAVYSEELSDNIGHINGPLVTKELSDSTTINYNPTQGGVDIDSYVGETTEDAQLTTNDNLHGEEVIEVGENVDITEESGTANHSPAVELTEEQVQEKNQEIEENLDEIAEVGDAAIEAGLNNQITDYDIFVEEVKKTNALLVDGYDQDTLVLNIKGNVLSDPNNYDALNKELSGLIYNNENKTNIVVNVDIPEEVEEFIITSAEMNRNYNSYDLLAAYLYWNFGSYDKTITFNTEWGGVVLAPKAEVNLNAGIHSGRVVAKVVTTGGEIHNAVIDIPPTPDVTPTPTPTPEVTPTPTPTPEVTPTPTPTPEVTPTPTPEPTKTPTPTPTVTPSPTPTPEPQRPVPSPTPTPVPYTPSENPPTTPDNPQTPTSNITTEETEVIAEVAESEVLEEYTPPAVLGVNREKGVLGAKRGKQVLGEKRGPETGDTNMMAVWFIVFLLSCMVVFDVSMISWYKKKMI